VCTSFSGDKEKTVFHRRNQFFYVGFVVAERVLYIPSIGYCLVVGLAVARVLVSMI
jgi:hypothetical protein